MGRIFTTPAATSFSTTTSSMAGTDIRIIADGSDEEEAVEGLVALVKSGFTE